MVSLQMDEGAGQLNQPLVKGAIRAVLVAEPKMFQYLVGLVKKLMVETMEIAKIMRIQFLPVMLRGHFGDAFAFAAHGAKVKSNVQSLKPKVTPDSERRQIARAPIASR